MGNTGITGSVGDRGPKGPKGDRGFPGEWPSAILGQLLPAVDFRTIPAPPDIGTPLKSLFVMGPKP